MCWKTRAGSNLERHSLRSDPGSGLGIHASRNRAHAPAGPARVSMRASMQLELFRFFTHRRIACHRRRSSSMDSSASRRFSARKRTPPSQPPGRGQPGSRTAFFLSSHSWLTSQDSSLCSAFGALRQSCKQPRPNWRFTFIQHPQQVCGFQKRRTRGIRPTIAKHGHLASLVRKIPHQKRTVH